MTKQRTSREFMTQPNHDPESSAPLFGNWRRAYLATFAVFVFEVALLYGFTRFFSS